MSEGPERYTAKTVEGRVARMVEDRAGAEFGPEALDKDEVACALNLAGEDLTTEEWDEISEFAVNAGAELLQAALDHDLLPTSNKEEAALERRIQHNKYRMFPIHDLFHAAEVYRETGGTSAAAPFVTVGIRERYTDPSLIRSELWPALFLISSTTDAPLAVLLMSREGRQDLDEAVGEGDERPSRIRKEITALLERPVPPTPEALRAEYEQLVGLLVIANAIEKVPDIVEAEVNALRAAAAQVGETPEPHYDEFVARVFSGEGRDNPRLFLDELLAAIRTKPETAEELEGRKRDFVEALTRATVREVPLQYDEAAVEQLARATEQSRLFVLGETHGAQENADVIYTLMQKLQIRRLALEWQPRQIGALRLYVDQGVVDFDAIANDADGRLTAEHFALVKKLHEEHLLDDIVGFVPEMYESFNMNDAAMAEAILALRGDAPLLVVAGSYHTRTAIIDRDDGGKDIPMGKILYDQDPAMPFSNIRYGGGQYYNLGLKAFDSSANVTTDRLYQDVDGTYAVELAEAHAASVPNRCRL